MRQYNIETLEELLKEIQFQLECIEEDDRTALESSILKRIINTLKENKKV